MNEAILPFRVGDCWLAVDALRITEIVGALPLVPIPGARATTPGVIGWQGKAVALVDLGLALFGMSSLREGGAQRTLIASSANCTLALRADQVREVQQVGWYRLPEIAASRLPYTSAELELDGKPVPLLDVDLLVSSLTGAKP